MPTYLKYQYFFFFSDPLKKHLWCIVVFQIRLRFRIFSMVGSESAPLKALEVEVSGSKNSIFKRVESASDFIFQG